MSPDHPFLDYHKPIKIIRVNACCLFIYSQVSLRKYSSKDVAKTATQDLFFTSNFICSIIKLAEAN